MIDRKLDTEHLAKEIGCRAKEDAKVTGTERFVSDADLIQFFETDPNKFLVSARFRDAQYIVEWAHLPETPDPKPRRKRTVKKKTAKKR